MNTCTPTDPFEDFLKRHRRRKKIGKTEAIKLVADVLDNINLKGLKHLPGCYLKGDEPPKLCDEHINENNGIDKAIIMVTGMKRRAKKALEQARILGRYT